MCISHGQCKAYDVLLNMADYVGLRMEKLSTQSISKMLYTTQANPANEPGGMNDVLYKLYRISKDEKHLKLAQIFDRKWFLMPLANNVGYFIWITFKYAYRFGERFLGML